MSKTKKNAFKAAFPHTIPIFAGFLFLGIAYGVYMTSKGFAPLFPIVMALVIFAGSMEFVTINLLLGAFNPIHALALALMVNARHLFYGISMLDKYSDVGKKKIYLIYGMCDESFSINCSTDVPKGVDKGWFMTFVTILNQFYWVFGTAVGAILGNFITFNTQGLDFVMTALFIVIFLEQWMKDSIHEGGVVGIVLTLVCLLIFGEDNFIIPSMLAIIIVLTLLRKPIEAKEAVK